MDKATQEGIKQLSKKLADEGKLVEAGWVMLRATAVDPAAGEIQLREMRMSFMAGAQHLFASIMTILDPGEDPSRADMSRMDNIDIELRAFSMELKATIKERGHG